MDKYYVSKTSLTAEERLAYHLYKHKGFTPKAEDWIIVFTIKVSSNTEALLLERKIEKRGAKRYLDDINAVR